MIAAKLLEVAAPFILLACGAALGFLFGYGLGFKRGADGRLPKGVLGAGIIQGPTKRPPFTTIRGGK